MFIILDRMRVNIYSIESYHRVDDKFTSLQLKTEHYYVKETPEEIDQLIERKLNRNLHI